MEIQDEIPAKGKKTNYLSEFLILIGTFLLSIIVFPLMGSIICSQIYDMPLEEVIKIPQSKVVSEINNNILKITQTFSLIGMLMGALLFLLTTRKHILSYVSLKQNIRLPYVVLSITLVLTLIPVVAYLINLNSLIATELGFSSDKLMGVYEALASSNSTAGFVFSIFLMSILPAVAEEFLFRGVLQTLLKKWSKNRHIAIIATSLIFAIIHMNPEQVLGILVLSLVLGYLYELTGNLIYPIILHASNNLLSVIGMKYAESNNNIEAFANDYSPSVLLVMLSAVITAAIFVILYKMSLKKEHE